MPKITQRLGLKIPLGNESVNRAAYNENLNILENKTVIKEDVKRLESQMAETTKQINRIVQLKENMMIYSKNWIDDIENSGFWIYRIKNNEVNERTIINFSVHLNDLEKASNFEIQNVTRSFLGYYEFYAKMHPTEDILLDITEVRG